MGHINLQTSTPLALINISGSIRCASAFTGDRSIGDQLGQSGHRFASCRDEGMHEASCSRRRTRGKDQSRSQHGRVWVRDALGPCIGGSLATVFSYRQTARGPQALSGGRALPCGLCPGFPVGNAFWTSRRSLVPTPRSSMDRSGGPDVFRQKQVVQGCQSFVLER